MPDEKLPFTGHLTELRKRIFVSVAVIFVCFMGAFHFSEDIFRALTLPMHSDLRFLTKYPFVSFIEKEGVKHSLIFLAPAEALWVHLKIALIAAIVVAVPVLFHQLWKFISPGLVEKEKKYAIPFIFVSSGLFFFGALFCFVIVIPFAINFLLTYKTESLTPMISVERYIDFCLKFILAFGTVFELPLVIVFLTRLGFVTPQTLAKNRKYAVLLAFVAAAILTPTPDAFNQTLMAAPIIVLYEGGLIAARLFVRRKKNDHDKREESESSGV
jgi:sec-independent protein translocase protein TatC